MSEDFFGKYDWEDKCILIVEDDISSVFYIKEVLNDTNARLIISSDGRDAIKACAENDDIDLVLMDIQLPVMNGYETTRKILEKHPDLPVVAQTAYALVDDRQKCIDAGCLDYISKPIDPYILLETIAKYI